MRNKMKAAVMLITHLVVNQSPLLQECMYTHNGADIPCQIASAGSDREVLCRAQAVCVDHEVAVILVYSRCFTPIPRVKELRERAALDGVDLRHVEPRRVRRYDDLVRLRCEILPRLLLEPLARRLDLSRVLIVVVISESLSSSPPSAIDTSASPCPPAPSSSSASSRRTRTRPEPVSGPGADEDASAGGRLPISAPGRGSSSLRLPGAVSGSTGEAPCACSGTVSFMRLASDGLGTDDPERLGVSIPVLAH